MRIRHFGNIAVLAAFSLATATAAGRCQLQQLGVLPVDMHGLHPLVSAKINGVGARFVLDSGSIYSTISRQAATEYHLPISAIPGGYRPITGIGAVDQFGTVESFKFLGVPLPKVRFLVVNQDPSHKWAGRLGQNNLLRISDVEYDLANDIVRFIRPVGCDGQPLAYWALRTPYTFVKLDVMDPLLATAMVNGQRVEVLFDTGSPRSYLSLLGAARVGITPSSPGVKFVGITHGTGPGPNRTWSAPLDTFQIGGENVEHAHVLLADLGSQLPIGFVRNRGPDMLLGEDFFLSHRIYVAYSQSKFYFTYNGGPFFNLTLPQVASGAAKPPPTAARTLRRTSSANRGTNRIFGCNKVAGHSGAPSSPTALSKSSHRPRGFARSRDRVP